MRRTTRLTTIAAVALAAALGLSACSQPVPQSSLTPTPTQTSDVNVTTVPYRQVGGQTLTADVCRSKTVGDARLPAVLLLHGGGFEKGDKLAMRQICETLASHGAVGISVEYRLLPAHSYPAQVEDAAAAVRWAKSSQAAKFGVDPARIGILGSSAGAIIAESVGVGMGGKGSDVKAVVALSGASDFTPNGLKLGKPGPAAEKIVLAYLGCSAVANCKSASAASPVLHVTRSAAPALLFASTAEIVPYQQTDEMAAALKTAGVATTVRKVPGKAHGLALLNASNLREIETFFTAQL